MKREIFLKGKMFYLMNPRIIFGPSQPGGKVCATLAASFFEAFLRICHTGHLSFYPCNIMGLTRDKKYFKPMIIYFRSATCFRNAKMFRSAFCLNEFPMVVEANDKADVLNVFKFCHQTNKL